MPFLVVYEKQDVVVGETRDDWRALPDDGVQVVARWPRELPVRWSCDAVPVTDRDLWTGEDSYDPFGWGVKKGSLLTDEQYLTCWRRACGHNLA